MKLVLLLYILIYSIGITAQNDTIRPNPNGKEEFVIAGDTTVYGSVIPLQETIIVRPPRLKDATNYKRYLILKRKVKKVYPYAKLAADTLLELNKSLTDIRKKRHRRKYIKAMQKYFEERFTPELKKMKRSEGRILIKLIHRQTGSTMYDLIKEYRSGVKAFLYERTARLFKMSLKDTFRPEEEYQDYLIEYILYESILYDRIKPQPAAFDIDLLALRKKWEVPIPRPARSNN